MKVLIAVPTTGQRDIMRLANALRSLSSAADSILILNGPIASAASAAILSRETGLRVLWSRRGGYSWTRNLAIEFGKTYDYLVFFDDDQLPVQGWLDSLLAPLDMQPRPAVVFGPVVGVSVGRGAYPAELLRSGLAKGELSGGEWATYAYSGNTLLDLKIIGDLGLKFKQEFNLSGGEDTEFFERLVACEERIWFAPEALAIELLDQDRRTLSSLYQGGRVNAARNVTRRSRKAFKMQIARPPEAAIRIAWAAIGLFRMGLCLILPDRILLAQGVRAIGMSKPRRYPDGAEPYNEPDMELSGIQEP